MSAKRSKLIALLIVALLASGAATSPAQPATPRAQAASPALSDAVLLVENAGQWPEAARFQVWNSPLGAGTTWLVEDGIWLVVSRQVIEDQVDKEGRSRCDSPFVSLPTCLPVYSAHALKLTFPGSNPDVHIVPFEPLTTTVSYFIGNNPDQWQPAVPVWGGVRYADLYPGVDLVLGGQDGVWRLEAAPGAAVDQVQVQVEGAVVAGLDRTTLKLDANGEPLSMTLPSAPFVYQATGLSYQGDQLTLAVYSGQHASQATRPSDDPTDALYATFLGGSDTDYSVAIAVDETGGAYVTGQTWSSSFPTTPGIFDPSYTSNGDAFVARLNPAGGSLVYATFLGGWNRDFGYGIALDETGTAYVTGATGSSDFPTTAGAFDQSFNSGYYSGDGFVVRLNPTGNTLIYATFLGGAGEDYGNAIAVDEAGNAYVTGWTDYGNFPTTPSAFDPTHNGSYDVFVAKLNAAGSALTYATFLGATREEVGLAIAVDQVNNAYVTGYTYSTDFPITPGALGPSYNDLGDVFVARLNATGSRLTYATFLGGSNYEAGTGIAVDQAGSAYVTGNTLSANFPATPGAFDPSFNVYCDGTPCYDAFVVKLSPAESELAYSTSLGGTSGNIGSAIALDEVGNVYVTGETGSSDFPTTPDAFDLSYNDRGDAFVAKLNPTGSGLTYATYLGGNASDGGRAIAVNETGAAFVTGVTSSVDFPTTPDAFDLSYNGGSYGDAFLVKLDMVPYTPDVVVPIEQPHEGAFVTGTITISGFAIDLGSRTGTGIDMVHIYLDGPYGTGTIIGGATYGLDRPDIAALYGTRFGPSGWELAWDTTGLAPGVHRLHLYAHRTTDATWSPMPSHLVLVAGGPTIWLPIGLHNR